MLKSKDKIYLLSIDSLQDIAYGVWEEGDAISVGLESHSISFNLDKLISDDEELKFETIDGNTVILRPMTKKNYDSIKGRIISSTAPEVTTDEESQKIFWSNKSY